MLRLLLGRDWVANRDEIMRRISQDIHSRKGNRVLIVPELISHEIERQLCKSCGDTASRYAEVLSFTRLARRVSDTMGNAAQECLDNGGRVVAMASSARQLSSQLKAYAAVESKPEFLTELIDAVDEFKRCCITSHDLNRAAQETQGSLAQKLEELALLMEGYDGLCSRGKRDPRDQMTWLLEQLEEGTYGEDHIFYIDGFPDFTRQNLAIIEHLIKVSDNVTVSLNCDQIDSDQLAFEKAGATAKELYQCAFQAGIPVQIEIIPEKQNQLKKVCQKLFQGTLIQSDAKGIVTAYCAESAYDECMQAAELIMDLRSKGCRYRDISVVCTDLAVYQPLISLVFHRFHIPVYQSGTEEILQKSVINTVLTGLEAVLTGFEQKNMLQYFRSALSPLEPNICDLVENYAIVWGIRGKKWTERWVNHPDGLSGQWNSESEQILQMINEARELAVEPLCHLQQGFHRAKNLQMQIMALYKFLEEIRLEERLAQLAENLDAAGDNRGAQILNQLWEILLSALEQMYDVLGDTFWEEEHFARLFRLLLSQYEVGTIPPVLDAVQMGNVSAMRCHPHKYLIVLGAEEGKLPGYTGSAGVLTDQERVTLRELGVPLTGGSMEGIQAEFAEIYGVFCGAEESIAIICSGEQPSFVFRRLSQMAGGEMPVQTQAGYAYADDQEAGLYLAKWNAEDTAVRLGLEEPYLRAATQCQYVLGKVAEENIRKLYGHTLNLSASQIDRYAECRLSYFLKYGLRMQERKEAVIDPAEFGTYVHAVLENTARCVRDLGGFHVVSLAETLDIAHRFSEEYAQERFSQLDSERITYLFRRNIQELDMIIKELWMELKDALFEPADFEVNFGGGESLPPIVIPNQKINAILRGFIDRVDTWHSGTNTYYRIVDYKTGKKDFDYCDVFNGVGLQMLLYMFALRDSGHEILGEHPIPAGVQYFPARVPYLPADGKLDEAEAEKERKNQWKRRGLLLQDSTVLQAMEPGSVPQRMCYSIRKDGSLSGDLADRDEMKLLEGYIFCILKEMVEDIAAGNVQPNPYTRGSSHNACTFCPYGSVCHEKTVEGRRNYQAMKADRFWDEIRKEMQRNGR